ncbi:MAG: hypothetical protein LBV23_05575 [Deltaproteobacteria bacterium]|jgi:hypothetical protein|nr:hypothetical protein [Deltaproteobacteria bacterium]
MIVSGEFLGYLRNKKEPEKKTGREVKATLKSSPEGHSRNPEIERTTARPGAAEKGQETDFLNQRRSFFSALF